MPPWQPNWNDVAFDQAKATEAASQCRTSAATLDTILGARSRLEATDHWTGGYQVQYAEEEPALFGALSNLRSDLLDLARRIEAGAREAAAEQTRREDQRELWRDERDR
ncbi:hypothetical protein BH24ACT4_BH24ACT4_21850 [soil metagenome]